MPIPKLLADTLTNTEFWSDTALFIQLQAHVCFLLPKLDFFNTLVKGLKLASSILLDFLLGNKKKHLSSLELGTNKTAATQ